MTDELKRNYQKELERVGKLISAAANRSIAEGRPTFERDLDRLTNVYLLYRYLVEREDVNAAPLAIRILYAKLTGCLAAILHLLQHGYAGPAAMVLRGLFETAVHLQVILKEDTPSRCQLFEEFLYITRHERMSFTPVSPEIRARNETDYARVRSNYHPKVPRSWAWKAVPSSRCRSGVPDNPSFRELCSHIEHPEYYDEIYGLLSAAIHPVPTYETWMRGADGNMQVGPSFTPHIQHVATVATTLAVDSLIRVAAGLSIPDAVEFGEFCVSVMGMSS